MKVLTVIIPVLNEEKTLEEIVQRVQDAPLPMEKEILIVNDGSTDGTRAILDRLEGGNVRVFHHTVNQGKGAGIRTAQPHVTGDLVVIQDADLEYYPEEYGLLAQPILDGRADVSYGTRFLGTHRVFLYWHYLGNRFLTFMTNILYNTMLSDMETCFKMCRSGIFRSMTIRTNRFGFEPEFTAKVFKAGHRVYEVPISYNGRGYEEGKKITWRDGVSALYFLIKFRMRD
ncbi:MAG: glycosyltransferase family 2 protein [Gemmatimonadota bacterium]|jgi:glycosyltransferase involved in cell wall biosynthesis|nr:glycosyltransferase family 2 protein [Gemmatimonadota bacterium]MDP6803488.1 glycosyltransferase family 2 protein [Gemmatimonadota bacterium]MDP7031707.1 glycosyltransferase family 2 protein [Gemmatimonadota bacterium]